MSSTLWNAGSESSLPELAGHQRDAVRWVLDRLARYEGVLLADDVGLGKSWVAAAVARELRGPADRVEALAPASLLGMWREVGSLFEITLDLISHETIRRSDPQATEACLVIVDEAHRFRNPATKGWRRLGLRIDQASAIFLTATPIWNSAEDLLSLLRLLVADDVLKTRGVVSIERGMEDPRLRGRILDQLVLRRRQEFFAEISSSLGTVRRRIVSFEVPRSWNGCERLIGALEFPHCIAPSRAILAMLMMRRLESSPAAFRATVERQLRFCSHGLDLLRQGFRLNRREFTRILVVEEGVQELLFPQLFLEPEDEPDAEMLEGELVRLEQLLDLAAALEDPKQIALREILQSDDLPTLVFVGAVETARACFEMLRSDRRVAVVTGRFCRSPTGARTITAIVEDFRSARIDLLITTDLGGEGLNLQRADRVIHYDLPWSPRRLDQRNGRARRIGRDGRALEIIELRPAGRATATLEAIHQKDELARSFWETEPASELEHPSLVRLPSYIPAAHPQALLWNRLPANEIRQHLLSRTRAGLELRMK